MAIASTNPATGELLRSFEPLTAEALEGKLALAAAAAPLFAAEALTQRAFWMRRLALLLDGDAEELAALITAEMGKTIGSARLEVAKCAAACRFYAERAADFIAPAAVATEHGAGCVRYDPLGVVLAIMPWNFPLWQVFRFLAPALMAGNTTLLKHAPNVPQCALAIEALVRRAGFPRGVVQTLLAEVRDVETLLADERVTAVTLTGSEAAGRAVAAQAGWLLKKAVLELGGSDAFIVMPAAELETTARNAALARCINNGQSCIAAKRFLVHADVYDRFSELFVAAMEALVIGDPTREATELGPVVSAAALDTLVLQVRSAQAAGGRLRTGGERMVGSGFYMEPTVIADVPRDAAICQQEIFGPVALLFRVTDVDDAIALANGTPFGLGASVWGATADERSTFAERLEAGSVFFDAPVASDPRLPFGGIKRSGFGRELGAWGMHEFMNIKTVVTGGAAAGEQSAFTFAEGADADRKADAEADTAPEAAPAPAEAPPAPPRRPRGLLQLD